MKTLKVLKTNLLVICMFVLFSLFTDREAMATTYYVSPSGSDKNSGSITAPFETIQKGADIVNPGDTVIVKDGTYTTARAYILYLNRSGTSDKWITFKSENKWGAKLDGQNSGVSAINIYSASYIRFEDFEVKGCGIGIYSNSHDIYLYRLYSHHVGQFACPTNSQADYDANKESGGKYFYHWNAHSGIFMDHTTSNITSDSLLIHNIGRLPCSWMQWSDYNKDHGYYVAGNNNRIINNIFYSIEAGWPIQIVGGDGWIVSNNVFYGSNEYESGRIVLINQVGAITNAIIQNNVAYHLHVSSGYYPTPSLVDLALYGGASGIQIKNNLVYKEGGTAKLYDQPYGNSSQWTASNNIVSKDPLFVNATNKDFHLQAGSPAINAGLVYSGRNFDADRNSINGLPDIGAYEYVSTPISTPTVDTIPPVSPTGLLAFLTTTDGIISNQGFESGTSPWVFYTNGAGTFSDDALGAGSPHAGHVSISQAGSNVQVQQANLVLEPNTLYQLSFKAYSNTGHDLSVFLHKHTSPYTNYGLSNKVFKLTSSWSEFSVQFTTTGFSGTVNDGRLRFWLTPYAAGGDQYFFDDVVLTKVSASD